MAGRAAGLGLGDCRAALELDGLRPRKPVSTLGSALAFFSGVPGRAACSLGPEVEMGTKSNFTLNSTGEEPIREVRSPAPTVSGSLPAVTPGQRQQEAWHSLEQPACRCPSEHQAPPRRQASEGWRAASVPGAPCPWGGQPPRTCPGETNGRVAIREQSSHVPKMSPLRSAHSLGVLLNETPSLWESEEAPCLG